MHRIRSGDQTITVTVPREPALAGIDPYHLLDWEERPLLPTGHDHRRREVAGDV